MRRCCKIQWRGPQFLISLNSPRLRIRHLAHFQTVVIVQQVARSAIWGGDVVARVEVAGPGAVDAAGEG